MGDIHELFVLALSLVWFARATPDKKRIHRILNDLKHISFDRRFLLFCVLCPVLLHPGLDGRNQSRNSYHGIASNSYRFDSFKSQVIFWRSCPPSGKKKAHKHKSFWPVTPPVTGGSPDREARGQSFMCSPRNPRNINLFVRIPDQEDR